MRKIILLISVLFLSLLCVAAHGETLRLDGTAVHFLTPESWLYANTGNLAEVSRKTHLAPEEIALPENQKQSAVLFYPINDAFDSKQYVELTLTSMESYQNDFSSYSDVQLQNIGKSFLRNGDYSAFEPVVTKAGLTFLKLTPSTASALDTGISAAYVTDENGIVLNIRCRGDVSAAETVHSLTAFLDSISIGNRQPGFLDLYNLWFRYRAILLIPLSALIVILWNERRKKKSA